MQRAAEEEARANAEMEEARKRLAEATDGRSKAEAEEAERSAKLRSQGLSYDSNVYLNLSQSTLIGFV